VPAAQALGQGLTGATRLALAAIIQLCVPNKAVCPARAADMRWGEVEKAFPQENVCAFAFQRRASR
jgi:hypothetical protein